MMNKLFLPVVAMAIFACSTGQCFAALGETEAELEKRYGMPNVVRENTEPSKPAEKVLHWATDDGVVIACLWRGRCVQETCCFFDLSGEKVPVNQRLKRAEAFLQANAAGAAWKSHPRLTDSQNKLAWSRSDGGAIAIVTTHSPNKLLVLDQTCTEARDAHRVQK